MEAHEAKKKKNLDDLRTTGGSSHAISIPADVIPEIFKGLPVKSLARFISISKECASFIRNRDFVKTYLMKSSDSPQSLIFTFEGKCSGKHFFFSSVQPQDQGESVSTSLPVYHMKCHFPPYKTFAPSVNGLICYGPSWKLIVYNPTTRRSIALPTIESMRIDIYHFLGYDPIGGDYKVLCMTKGDPVGMRFGIAQELQLLTLGKDKSWRMIEDFPLHFLDFHESPDICIQGVLYYRALLNEEGTREAFMSFDVRSEKFDLIKGPELLEHRVAFPKLTCYEGKLAFVFSKLHIYIYTIELWVLEDAATHEWSMQSYSFPIINGELSCYNFTPFFVVGEGELVLAPVYVERRPFEVLYYDPKKNRVRRVLIEGITGREDPLWNKDPYHRIISVIPGHANNLMFL